MRLLTDLSLLVFTLLSLVACGVTAADIKNIRLIDARPGNATADICCLSGIDTQKAGEVILISDRGALFRGTLDDQGRTLRLKSSANLRLSSGRALTRAAYDAEGLAILPDGTLAISFEGRHSVTHYESGGTGIVAWRLPEEFKKSHNQGAEALAVDGAGSLWLISEKSKGEGFSIFSLRSGAWTNRGIFERLGSFKPVGADFDAAGRLYILERSLRLLGFTSRIRRIDDPRASTSAITIWQSRHGSHDNLEGIAVLESDGVSTQFLLVSDDNDFPLQSTEVLLLTLPVAQN